MHKKIDEIEARRNADLEALVNKKTLDLVSADPVPELDIPFVDLNLPPPNFGIDYSGTPGPAPADDEPWTAPATGSGKTVRVSIRLPSAVINEFKKRAILEHKGYQTLIVRALREHLGRR